LAGLVQRFSVGVLAVAGSRSAGYWPPGL